MINVGHRQTSDAMPKSHLIQQGLLKRISQTESNETLKFDIDDLSDARDKLSEEMGKLLNIKVDAKLRLFEFKAGFTRPVSRMFHCSPTIGSSREVRPSLRR